MIKLGYDQAEYPLADAVARILGVEVLAGLLPPSGMAVVERANDQDTRFHAAFYAGFDGFQPLYERFVEHIAAHLLDEPYYFQAVPTFRVQFPGNLAVGEMHRDRDYHHPDGEVNFWVPLTPTSATSTVWIQTDRHTVPRPVTAQPGEVLSFDAVNDLHGNVFNTTGLTRVSFDFRCLPVRRYVRSDARTLNTAMRFAPGGYYALTAAQPPGHGDDPSAAFAAE